MSLWRKVAELSRGTMESIADETNIIGKYNDETLLTKDGNLSLVFELKGISYSSHELTQQMKFLDVRNVFFKSIPPTVSITVFQKRSQVFLSQASGLTNPYAKEIIQKWEEDREGFVTRYFVCLTTKTKSLASFLEKKKAAITSSRKSENSLEFTHNQLEDIYTAAEKTLDKYGITRLSAAQALSFFASYANMEETNVGIKDGLLQDHYISANVTFDKDYIKHESTKETYTRFLSVKAYDTEEINNQLIKKLLSFREPIMVCEQINNISKDKALRKIGDKLRLSNDIVRGELDELQQLVNSDRETILYYSLSVLLSADSLDQLDELTTKVKQLFAQNSIIVVPENLNLKPLYFSFFPGRGQLNARQRIITSMNVSTLNFFEKDVAGFKKNSWGDSPLSVFPTPDGALHFFNLHNSERETALGHTIVIADSESGKTTLISFLMMCMEKYGILRLAFDKLKGMYCMSQYLGGEYANISDMQLNPFSLSYDAENISFLENFLFQMGGITDENHLEIAEVRATLERLYQIDEVITLSDFVESLPKVEGLAQRFMRYQDGIFDNENCLLSFENSLNVLAMDGILDNEKLSSITAYYVFHKLKRIAEKQGRGFFVFIDELKDYINNKDMAKLILERIVEARKSNGVMTVAVQNLDFFDHIENRDSFLDGFAHYIIFPTRTEETLDKLRKQLNLNESELEFLRTTDPTKERFVLFKNRKTQESIVLDISLARLGEHLNVFNSSAHRVAKLKELQEEHPQNWRKEYLAW